MRTAYKLALRKLRWSLRRRPSSNLDYNRELWDAYAKSWDESLVQRDARGRGRSEGDSPRVSVLGEEWGSVEDVGWIIGEYIDPFIGPHSVVGEIGPGGGRFTAQIVDRVDQTWCFDISEGMERRLRGLMGDRSDVHYVHLAEPGLPVEDESLDFVFSFDVFVHLDLHVMWRYFQEIERTLRPGGHAFIHTTDLTSPGGWAVFSAQDRYRPETHFFVTPETVRTLVRHTSLKIVEEATQHPERQHTSEYFLFVAQKPSTARA